MRRPNDTLAHRLVLLRHEQGLSQREAALRTGVSFGVWQGMESGRATRGVDRAVAAIAATLKYDREWLMWGGSLSDPFQGPGVPNTTGYVVGNGTLRARAA